MKKSLRKWRTRKAGKRLAEAVNNYDRGYEDGCKDGYNKGRLSLSWLSTQIPSLIMRVDRLDKAVTKLETKGAGTERDKPF